MKLPALEDDGLQLCAPRERFAERLQARFDGFAADGHSVEQALAVEVFDRRGAGSVGLGLQVSPLDRRQLYRQPGGTDGIRGDVRLSRISKLLIFKASFLVLIPHTQI